MRDCPAALLLVLTDNFTGKFFLQATFPCNLQQTFGFHPLPFLKVIMLWKFLIAHVGPSRDYVPGTKNGTRYLAPYCQVSRPNPGRNQEYQVDGTDPVTWVFWWTGRRGQSRLPGHTWSRKGSAWTRDGPIPLPIWQLGKKHSCQGAILRRKKEAKKGKTRPSKLSSTTYETCLSYV